MKQNPDTVKSIKIFPWDFEDNSIYKEAYLIKCENMYPGMINEFQIIIKNEWTTPNIQYNIEIINNTQKPKNIYYIFEEEKYSDINNLKDVILEAIYNNENIEESIYTIKIAWDFETGENEEEIKENNVIDTNDMKELSSYSFMIILSAHKLV